MSFDLPTTMKALVKTSEGKSFEYKDVPVPVPQNDEVLIKVDAMSVCGSDINLYNWNDVARVIASVPFTPGHECAGTVVKCGPQASIPLGSKVGVENHYYCGSCYQCTHDEREICKNMGQFGHGKKTSYGGAAEYTIVPAKFLYTLKRDLSPDEIAMLEPLGVAHNATERLSVKGEDVLVIGCGAVGLLFVMEFTNTDGMGRICECSGAPIMVNASFSMLLFKALTLKTVHGRRIYHTWEETENLVADGKVDVNRMISHRFPMSKFEEAFD
ncbi:hypothetical protein KUTeg_004382, partial [Tegillarca granosa]